MKKLFLIFVILITFYVVSIFQFPTFANMVTHTLGLESFQSFVLSFKKDLDSISTDTPTKQELIDTYNKALSGAIQLRDDIINGAHITKERIDSVRATLSGAEDAYNDIKEKYSDAVEFIEGATEQIQEAKEIIDAVSPGTALTNTGS